MTGQGGEYVPTHNAAHIEAHVVDLGIDDFLHILLADDVRGSQQVLAIATKLLWLVLDDRL